MKLPNKQYILKLEKKIFFQKNSWNIAIEISLKWKINEWNIYSSKRILLTTKYRSGNSDVSGFLGKNLESLNFLIILTD